jgi:hypothetical protein
VALEVSPPQPFAPYTMSGTVVTPTPAAAAPAAAAVAAPVAVPYNRSLR